MERMFNSVLLTVISDLSQLMPPSNQVGKKIIIINEVHMNEPESEKYNLKNWHLII